MTVAERATDFSVRARRPAIQWLLADPGHRSGIWLLCHISIFVIFCLVFYALVPRFLLQDHDGQSAYYNIAGIFEWRDSWIATSTFSPLSGAGSPFWPYNVSLIPSMWPYALTGNPTFRIYFEMVIAATAVFSGSAMFNRALRLPPWLVVLGAWIAFAIVMLQSNEWMRGTDATFQFALLPICIACLIEIEPRRRTANYLWGLGFVIALTIMVLSHPGWFVLAVPALLFFSLCVVLSSETWQQAALRGGAVVLACLLHIAIGSFESIYFMMVNTARVLRSDAYLPAAHSIWLAGPLFRNSMTEIVTAALLIVGIVSGKFVALSKRPRPAQAIWLASVVIFTGSVVVGLLYINGAEIERELKPSYFTPFFLPLTGLFVVLGIRVVWQWLGLFHAGLVASQELRVRVAISGLLILALLAWHAMHDTLNWLSLAVAVLILMVIAVLVWRRQPIWAASVSAAGALLGFFLLAGAANVPFVDERDGVLRMAVQPNPIVEFLSTRIGLKPGNRFHGYADDAFSWEKSSPQLIDHIVAQWDSNWREYGNGMKLFNWGMSGIPILTSYSPYLDPLYFTAFSAFFNYRSEQQVVNYITITKPDIRLLQLFGLRYLITNQELGGAQAVAHWRSIWINELPNPNRASYTPTKVTVARDAESTIAHIANASFDPTKEAVVDIPILTDALVPTAPAELIFERGGFRIDAKSSGRSLIVLPIQFSHCFTVEQRTGDSDSRLLRVNLVQTGLLFSGQAHLSVKFKRWPRASPQCQREDYRDSLRLLRK